MYPNLFPAEFTLPEAYTEESVDLTTCDREPIHIPGKIQPRGFLLCFSDSQPRETLAYSGNYVDFIKPSITPNELNQFLWIPEAFRGKLEMEFVACLSGSVSPFSLPIVSKDNLLLQGIASLHYNEQGVVLEWEPEDNGKLDLPTPDPIFYSDRLKRKSQFQDLIKEITEITYDATGFDRVMLYRFDKDWNGQIVAEHKKPELDSYLHLHYPATDIPVQARLLYLRNTVRFIHDIHYKPVSILLSPNLHSPLDLSLSKFRAVSPIHIAYLNNMGVTATLTISIIIDGKLWGLVACHHSTPKHLSLVSLRIAEWFSEIFSLHLKLALTKNKAEYSMGIKKSHDQILGRIIDFGMDWKKVAMDESGPFSLFHCDGSSLAFQNSFFSTGTAPSPDSLQRLVNWLRKNAENLNLFSSDNLPFVSLIPGLAEISISGILAVPLDESRQDWMIWFRKEYIQTIFWAGDPESKETSMSENGLLSLSPRQSFDKYKQILRGKSLPWLTEELEGALQFVQSLKKLLFNQMFKIQDLESEIASIKIEEEVAKQQLVEKEIMIKEIHHRVKNNLQVINSILYLQSSFTKNDETITSLLETQNRIRSMSVVHEMLYQSETLSRVSAKHYFGNLIENIFQTFTEKKEKFSLSISIEDVFLDLDTGIPLGLVLNELFTNALKYSVSGQSFGEIEIQLHLQPEGDLLLSVSDSGPGLPETVDLSRPNSLGLILVQSLAKQLKASLEFQNRGRFTVKVLVPWKRRLH